MHTSSHLLSPERREKIVAHLDECLVLFNEKPGLLSVAELRAKSLLTVLRDEIAGKSAILESPLDGRSFPPRSPT